MLQFRRPFAKKAGCRVYGIAGGADKGKLLTDKLGADGAIGYKKFTDTDSMSTEIIERTGGVDVYFDNVGGHITDAVIPQYQLTRTHHHLRRHEPV